MKNELTRRTFVKGSATAALALGTTSVAKGFPANEKVQLGWIGIGGRGSGILKHMVNHCSDGRTAAVCDLKPDRIEVGKKIAERDKPKGYTDFREMMDKEKLDGILVATKPNDHAGVVIPVLEAGFNTFSEKPMATVVEEVDAITKAARKAKGFFQIGTQRRYNPGFTKIMPLIHQGKYGKVTFMQGCWHWPWTPKMSVEIDGGELIEQACHHLDVMAWAMKEQHPIRCVSMGYQQVDFGGGPNVWTETHSSTSFQFPDGQVFSYTHLFYLPPKCTEEKLMVFCEEGAADLVRTKVYKKDKTADTLGESSHTRWGRGTKEGLCDFVANIKEGGKRIPNANVETGRVATLMSIMGRMAMVNTKKNNFEPRVIEWKDLKSTTEPTADA